MQLVVTDPVQIKRKSRKKQKSLIGRIVVALIAIELMCFTSFVGISLPTATGTNLKNYLILKAQALIEIMPYRWQSQVIAQWPIVSAPVTNVRYTLYTPAAPGAILLAYILGFPLATIVVAAFVVLGLVGPIFDLSLFACGGGLTYYTQPGFGYLIGIILATIAVSHITANKRTSLRQLFAIVGGVVIVHCAGFSYLLGSCLILAFLQGPHAHPTWHAWVLQYGRNMTWYPLPYDLLFTFLIVGLGFPFKWLVSILTAPDISLSSKNLRIDPAHVKHGRYRSTTR